MGKVSKYLAGLIAKQVEDKGIVVWYEPEGVYPGLIDKLTIQNSAILRYEGSFFALRAQIEPFLEFIGEDGKPRPERKTGILYSCPVLPAINWIEFGMTSVSPISLTKRKSFLGHRWVVCHT